MPVASLSAERTGVLVIRAWVKPDGGSRLRARITRVRDVTHGPEISTAAANAEQITSVVAEWLEELVQPDR